MFVGIKTAAVAVVVLALGSSIAGCGQNDSVNQAEYRAKNEMMQSETKSLPNRDMMMEKNNTHYHQKLSMDSPEETGMSTGMEHNAKQLENRADQVTGVGKAAVVILKKDAFVALSLDENGKKTIIEKQVYAALKGQYPAYDIHVTADEGLRERITELNALIGKGAPIQSLSKHAALIVQDINAQLSPAVR
ncbi:YhcN/YlaJ family sporulation lipoprotein [Paenibacillus sp. 2TAB23]|uniref:YhcN/YlaJ family sporulation lipoprotein n=1 Tax=Paenibacillus sp. 2TAB23 TaxID=3233004 RepID=UPI003F962B2F